MSLCLQARKPIEIKGYMCPNAEWTCWRKYHDFYYPKKLYSMRGNVCSLSELYKQRKIEEGEEWSLRY